MPRYGKNFIGPRKPTRKYTKKTKSVTNANKAYVKKEINNKIGFRTTDVTSKPYVWGTSNTTMSPAITLLDKITDMVVGSSDGERLGNEITLNKMILNINLSVNAEVISKPIIVSIFVGYIKSQPIAVPGGANLNLIYNVGGSATGDTGKTLELLYGLNTERFKVKRYQFKIAPSSIGTTYYNNNDFKYFINKKINILPFMRKKVQYFQDDSQGINQGLFMWANITGVDSKIYSDFPLLNYYVETEYLP